MINTPSTKPAAVAAAAGLAGLTVFQLLLAAGTPLGGAAWGGRHDGQLPADLRVGSAFSVLVYLLAIAVILRRAGLPPRWLPYSVARVGAWALTVLLALGSIENCLSQSAWERFVLAPASFLLAALCLLVARSHHEPTASSAPTPQQFHHTH